MNATDRAADRLLRAIVGPVLGEEVPAFVQISGGFRACSATRARVA